MIHFNYYVIANYYFIAYYVIVTLLRNRYYITEGLKYILVTIDSVDKLEDTLKKIYSGALKAEDFTPGGLMNLLKILNKAKKENGAFQVQLKLGD